jgi:catechol 2,3-dioxygenase-like lactoylglutathione lyase family enzyme
MNVLGLTWLGTRAAQFDEMVRFAEDVLGLARSFEREGVVGLELPDGSLFEVFAPGGFAGGHPREGVVGGFEVDNLATAREELEAAGVEVADLQTAGGPGAWFYFRAPDGNLYELIGPA